MDLTEKLISVFVTYLVSNYLLRCLSRGRYSKTCFNAVREAATSQILELRAKKRVTSP